jgi:glycosyltransferase involved in cell wall biosynthesis
MTDLIIACPYFNRFSYVKQTLESLYDKIGDEYKVWLFDDGSTDVQVNEYVEAKCKSLKNWKIYKNDKRGGMMPPYPGMLKHIATKIKDESDFLILIDSDFLFSSQWKSIVLQCIEIEKIHLCLISLLHIHWLGFHNPHGEVEINNLPLYIKKAIKSGSLVLTNDGFCQAVNNHICNWNAEIGHIGPWDHMICDYYTWKGWQTYSTRVSYADHIGIDGLSMAHGGGWAKSIDFIH